MKKQFILFSFLFSGIISMYGYVPRDLLQKKADIETLQLQLIADQKWVPYPAYTDRSGWDALTGDAKQEIIHRGELALNYQWQVVTASQYLEFERSGSRKVMENPYWANNDAITDLVLAELAEGKG
ncbi:MAG: heparinase, partial [Bacteroidetes bacterium]|nr:heparinase [Bacteroidota bacterium]